MTTEQDVGRGEWSAPRDRRWTEEDGREMLAALRASGLSMSQFAREHGFSSKTAYRWRRRLGETTVPLTSPPEGVIPVRIVSRAEVKQDAQRPTRGIEVAIRNTIVIRVQRDFDAELLQQVVRVLEEAPC